MINMRPLFRITIVLALACQVLPPARGEDTAGAETDSVEKVRLPLSEAIMRARTNSVDAAVALDKLRTSWWEHRSYRAELLPEVIFRATAPAYYKQYSPYMGADGNYTFVRNNYLQLNGEVSVRQNIWLTGGQISLTTSLDFMRQLDGTIYNRFMSIPVALTLDQPIFGINNLKWSRRIEPVRFDEAKARFLSETEEVAMLAISYYFNLLMSRENRSIALQNLDNARRLHEVAVEKRKMGRISENDLLQMELNLLNARSAYTDNESQLRSDMFRLRTFLGLGEDADILPEIPQDVPTAEIGYADALAKAKENNCHAKNLRRRQLEADYAVAKAKGDLRSINLFAQIGYTGASQDLSLAYNSLRPNQIARIGFEIPILDWGKRRGKVKVAESNRRVTRSSLEREDQEFNQNLYILVERYGNQQRQLEIARKADEIARRRYQTNVETFMIGKISTLDLNDSEVKKDEARREYVRQLYLFWYYYYQIRSVTLWDYSEGKPLTGNLDF